MTVSVLLLFVFQLVAHAGLVYGLLSFTMWEWLVVLFVYFLTGCLGVSITLHRSMAHRAVRLPRWFQVLGSLFATYGLIGSPIAWVNNHRTHHKHADQKGDPHSPSLLGLVKVQWFSMFTSAQGFSRVREYTRDRFHLWLHQGYFAIHLLLLVILPMLVGWYLTAVLYLAPAAVLWNAGSFINTVCHSNFGYRNHETDDKSRNVPLLGYLVWGEGWHNNHHSYPARISNQEKWWEFDLSGTLLRILRR